MFKLRIAIILAVVTVGLFATTTIALAADPFLCPVVGDGVKTADANNGDNGVSFFKT